VIIPTTINARSEDFLETLLALFEESVRRFFDVSITPWQRVIAREIFLRVFARKRHTIVISVCRQVGKTEIVMYCVWFLTYVFPLFDAERFRCVITAPEKGTGSEVYDRVKMLFDSCEQKWPSKFRFKRKNLDGIVTSDDSSITSFGLFKGYASREGKKTTKEGRTFHLAVRDEMHLGEDEIFSDEIEPALSTTGGVDVLIGNGGYRECKAKQLIDGGTSKNVTVFAWDYDTMRAHVLAEYEASQNAMWGRWVESQDHYVAENGRESDVVKKNLYLEWLVTVGNFVSWEKLKGFARAAGGSWSPKSNSADIGVDWGKEHDETVATMTDYANDIREWATFHGEYPDQIDALVEWAGKTAKKNGVSIKNFICDATGSGDPNVSMLKRKTRIPVIGVVFTAMNKDKLAKKGLNALAGKEPSQTLSYPANHPLASVFEHQMRRLEKEYRADGKVNYHHPKENDARDDYPDSWLLSIWKIQAINKVRTFMQTSIN